MALVIVAVVLGLASMSIYVASSAEDPPIWSILLGCCSLLGVTVAATWITRYEHGER